MRGVSQRACRRVGYAAMTLRTLLLVGLLFSFTWPGIVWAQHGDGAKGAAWPNPPRFAVCEGKEEGAACTFDAKGAQMSGSCVKRGRRMFCKLEPVLPREKAPKTATSEADGSGE